MEDESFAFATADQTHLCWRKIKLLHSHDKAMKNSTRELRAVTLVGFDR